MPEETNRILVDHVSTWRLAASTDALHNLSNERLSSTLVGNISVESLLRYGKQKNSEAKPYILVEIHRVENDGKLRDLLNWAESTELPVLWLQHPRYMASGAYRSAQNVRYLPPQEYAEGTGFTASAALLVTDSGGMQVDAAVLGVPCITVRKNTEWRVTVERGVNTLVLDVADLPREVQRILRNPARKADFSDQLWDDGVADRIISEILG